MMMRKMKPRDERPRAAPTIQTAKTTTQINVKIDSSVTAMVALSRFRARSTISTTLPSTVTVQRAM
jgi:hypothetical protein